MVFRQAGAPRGPGSARRWRRPPPSNFPARKQFITSTSALTGTEWQERTACLGAGVGRRRTTGAPRVVGSSISVQVGVPVVVVERVALVAAGDAVGRIWLLEEEGRGGRVDVPASRQARGVERADVCTGVGEGGEDEVGRRVLREVEGGAVRASGRPADGRVLPPSAALPRRRPPRAARTRAAATPSPRSGCTSCTRPPWQSALHGGACAPGSGRSRP